MNYFELMATENCRPSEGPKEALKQGFCFPSVKILLFKSRNLGGEWKDGNTILGRGLLLTTLNQW